MIFLLDAIFVGFIWRYCGFQFGVITLSYCGIMTCIRYKYNRFVINTIMGLKEEIRRLGGVV